MSKTGKDPLDQTEKLAKLRRDNRLLKREVEKLVKQVEYWKRKYRDRSWQHWQKSKNTYTK